MAPLVVVAMIATAITAFFYLRIVVLMYFSPPAERAVMRTAAAAPSDPVVVGAADTVGAVGGDGAGAALATISAPRVGDGGVFVVIPSVLTGTVIGFSALVTLALGIAPELVPPVARHQVPAGLLTAAFRRTEEKLARVISLTPCRWRDRYGCAPRGQWPLAATGSAAVPR